MGIWLLPMLLLTCVRPAAAQLIRPRHAGESNVAISRKAAKVCEEISGQVRPGDEVWIVNTRSAHPSACVFESLEQTAHVYEKIDGQYFTQDVSSLLQRINSDTVRENIVFIHGNRTDSFWARLRGTQTYEAILDVNEPCPSCSLPPVRWIIWSWPTDIVRGPKRDLSVKRQRASGEGQLLVQFLSQIERPEIGVLSYSLGAQALVSALCCWQDEVVPVLEPPRVEDATNAPVAVGSPPILTSLAWEHDGPIPAGVNDPVAGSEEKGQHSWATTETIIDLQQSSEMELQIMERTDQGCRAERSGTCRGPKLRIVMVAAAVPAKWFRTKLGHDCMQHCTSSLTLVNNPRDRVLDIYRKLTHLVPLGSEPQFNGPFPTLVHLVRNKGLNNHVLTEYFAAESTRQLIRDSLLHPSMTVPSEPTAGH